MSEQPTFQGGEPEFELTADVLDGDSGVDSDGADEQANEGSEAADAKQWHEVQGPVVVVESGDLGGLYYSPEAKARASKAFSAALAKRNLNTPK